MKARLKILALSIFIGLVATAGLMFHISGIRAEAVRGNELTPVLVAQQAVPVGASVEDMHKRGALKFEQVPTRFVAQEAIRSEEEIAGQVLGASVGKGEQVTDAKFRHADHSGLSVDLEEGMRAIAIPVDNVIGVSGLIRSGDHVDIVATFSPGPDGGDLTRTLLQNVLVLVAQDVDGELAGTPATADPPGSARTITFALTPSDAEKLVFAQEKGHLWLTLRPLGSEDSAETAGQRLESVFR